LKAIIETVFISVTTILLVAVIAAIGYELSTRVAKQSLNEKPDALAARAAASDPSSQGSFDEDDQTLVDLPGDAIGFPKDKNAPIFLQGGKKKGGV